MLYGPTAASVWVQEKVVSAPGASSLAPPVMSSQLASVRVPKLSATLPVFLTTTWYSTAWPILAPVISDFVNEPTPATRWSFSIVKVAFLGTLTSTLLELSVSGKPKPIGGVPVTDAWLAYLPTVLAMCSHV